LNFQRAEQRDFSTQSENDFAVFWNSLWVSFNKKSLILLLIYIAKVGFELFSLLNGIKDPRYQKIRM